MANELESRSSSGIFLVYGGCQITIFESQVLVHVYQMGQAGIKMEVWTFAGKKAEYTRAISTLPMLQKSFPGIKIRVFRGVRGSLPCSEWCNALLLLWQMWRLDAKPSFIHARTEYAATVAAIGKRVRSYRLIWDARGATLNEFGQIAKRLPSRWQWWVALNSRTISWRLRMAGRRCDGAIFVSDELRRLDGEIVPVDRTLIVPCLADESLFYFDPYLRQQMRADFGYAKDDIIIAYVGSTVSWQCIPETIALMKRALDANSRVKILIVTPDREVFEAAFSADSHDRVYIGSGMLHEINRYLNAADFGVLLRKSNLINKVASPVKFAEYSLAGLTVITTDAVEQVKQTGRRLGHVVEPEEFLWNYLQGSAKTPNRSDIANNARAILGRRSYVSALVKFYSMFQ